MSALHSGITTITQNIPWFLRRPAEGLIGEKCYKVLVYNFDVTDGECLKYALSKGLGLGIVLGGSIVKVPQIIKILSTQSARGLSLSAYLLETTSYAISLAYASRNHFPFSTYGENFFLTIQNVLITFLILNFTSRSGAETGKPMSESINVARLLPAWIATVAAGFFLSSPALCPPSTLTLLQAATLPLSLSSKVPQIISNYTNRSTGNLSAFAVFNALIGCIARLFTTKQEVNDPLIFWGFAGAAVFNAVIAGQMVLYWRSDGSVKRRRATEDGPMSPNPLAKGSSTDGGKQRVRKLD